MKNLYLTLPFVFFSITISASHIVGGEIRISHLQNFDYLLEMSLFRDSLGIQAPQVANVGAYKRDGLHYIQNFALPLDTFFTIEPKTTGCGSPILTVEHYKYSATITLGSHYWTDSAGYIFAWGMCCRNGFVQNIAPPSAGWGSAIVTLIPPVMKGNVQFINSSPKLKSPISDFAIDKHPYYLDFGGIDPDGDSIAYSFYTPFDANVNLLSPNNGTTTGYTWPYSDPSTQIPSIQWAPGYSANYVIPGLNGTNQNALQINQISGELTLLSDAVAPAYYIYGIWAREYRNGELIGSVYRDFQLSLLDYQIDPNTAPQVHVPQLQSLATWDADTMVFTGSPVCVQLGVTDPDSIADIEIEAVYSDYDPGDLVFVQNSAIILNPDTFQTALCFQPDSFLPYTTRGDVVALNPGCYDLRGDTLPFYFKFVGYSNAGWGGNQDVMINSQLSNIDLFGRLSGNPNAGGSWLDLDNSGLLNNGIFYASGINSPVSFRFAYIDQQPNYQPDTAFLTLNFKYPNSIEDQFQNTFEVFPNPANGVLNISGINDISNIEIFDIQGKKIRTVQMSPEQNTVNTAELKEGLYFYQCQNQRGKFLIER